MCCFVYFFHIFCSFLNEFPWSWIPKNSPRILKSHPTFSARISWTRSTATRLLGHVNLTRTWYNEPTRSTTTRVPSHINTGYGNYVLKINATTTTICIITRPMNVLATTCILSNSFGLAITSTTMPSLQLQLQPQIQQQPPRNYITHSTNLELPYFSATFSTSPSLGQGFSQLFSAGYIG